MFRPLRLCLIWLLTWLDLNLYVCMHAKSFQSCLTLCDPMDCSPPRSSVHGILQARPLEWVAIFSSRGSSRPRDWTCVSYTHLHWQVGSLLLVPPGKPWIRIYPLAICFLFVLSGVCSLCSAFFWVNWFLNSMLRGLTCYNSVVFIVYMFNLSPSIFKW